MGLILVMNKKIIRGINWSIVGGRKLNVCKNNIVDIVVESHKSSIIKGNVYNINGKPCANAIVEIDEINTCNNEVKVLGYSVTNDKGEYQISINPIYYMDYEIKVYPPLKISREERVCGK